MDPVQLHALPHAVTDPLDRDLEEVDAAIELVLRGAARRVRLVNLASVDRIAFMAVARAQQTHVALVIDREGASPSVTIGPRQ